MNMYARQISMSKQTKLIWAVVGAMIVYWTLTATILGLIPRDIVVAASATAATVLLVRWKRK